MRPSKNKQISSMRGEKEQVKQQKSDTEVQVTRSKVTN